MNRHPDTSELRGMPVAVVETHHKTIRNKERQYFLDELAWRICDKGQKIADIKYRRMSTSELRILAKHDHTKHRIIEVVNWADDQVIFGDYAIQSMGKDGHSKGVISFCLTNTQDAFIIQVQGKKGKWYGSEVKIDAIKTALVFLKELGIKRVFLINGDLINNVRKEPQPQLIETYKNIAANSKFKENIWGLPYINLETT